MNRVSLNAISPNTVSAWFVGFCEVAEFADSMVVSAHSSSVTFSWDWQEKTNETHKIQINFGYRMVQK